MSTTKDTECPPDCLGCKFDEVITRAAEAGADPDVLIRIFFGVMERVYSDTELVVLEVEREERVVH